MHCMKRDADVIVLGAGLAGLSAAATLAAAGKSVLLLEARERAGGRVFTARDAATTYPMELGPEWVSATGALRELLNALNADVRTTEGAHLVRRQNDLLARENFDEMMEIMGRIALQVPDGGDLSLDEALDRYCTAPELARSRAAIKEYVQGYHAADSAKVSVRWLLEAEVNEPATASEGHALSGLDVAINALSAALPKHVMCLQTVATEVSWRESFVEVQAERSGRCDHIRCRRTGEHIAAGRTETHTGSGWCCAIQPTASHEAPCVEFARHRFGGEDAARI